MIISRNDLIDDVEFEVDGEYNACLILQGDFVNTFEDYLRNRDSIGISLRITRETAADLYKQIGEYL